MRIEDLDKQVSSEDTAHTATGLISDYLFDKKETPKSNMTYCGLGAGDAVAELDLAKKIGVRGENITLVDMEMGFVSSDQIDDLDVVNNTDIFKYLNSTEKSFDLISAFGLEYLLSQTGKMSELIKGILRVVKPLGFVVVTGLNSSPELQLWENSGFESIYVDEGFLIFRKKS